MACSTELRSRALEPGLSRFQRKKSDFIPRISDRLTLSICFVVNFYRSALIFFLTKFGSQIAMDDGLLYRGHGKGEAFGPTYTVGDTVGCGINYANQKFFFTKNGVVIGNPIPTEVKGPLFPTIYVHSLNEEVTINFGKDPFVFYLKGLKALVSPDI